MKLRDFERKVIVSTRYLTVIAVFGSLAGSVLMFLLGLFNIGKAFAEGLSIPTGDDESFGAASVISVIEGLDRFLIAIVLLYFGYGVYTLFLHPEESEEGLALPQWLQVKQIGQLKTPTPTERKKSETWTLPWFRRGAWTLPWHPRANRSWTLPWIGIQTWTLPWSDAPAHLSTLP